MFRYAYLHGFASGSRSTKGLMLARELAPEGVELELPDLNAPSFARLTITSALVAMDALDAAGPAEARWRLVGSSFGGYLAARWAELNPSRVDRLLLLCPGFEMRQWWPDLVGVEAMARWEREGALELPDALGVMTPVRWGFVEDAGRHPKHPEPRCPIRIIHGRQDETVPFEVSSRYAAARPHVRLVAVDDDHHLSGSHALIAREARGFLVRAEPA
jgi:uncharacterized protein